MLFERVYEEGQQLQQSQSMIATKYAATKIIVDLCTLCEKRNVPISSTNPIPKKLHCNGPFSFLNLGSGVGGTGISGSSSTTGNIMKSRCMSPLPPPRSFCLELLDMILSQKNTQSLFFSENNDNEFVHLLKTYILPLVKSILYEELLLKERSSSSNPNNPIDYCLLVRCILLCCTIIIHTKKSIQQQQSSHKEEEDNENNNDYCFDIINILCRFVIISIERIQDLESFEVRYFLYFEYT